MLSFCSDSPPPAPPQNNHEPSESSEITKYHLNNPKRGRNAVNMWAAEEDHLLKDIMEKTKNLAWKEVALLFNRYNKRPRKVEDIRQHWARVICAQHAKWTDEEDAMLITAVLQCKPHDWRSVCMRLNGRNNNEVIARLKILRKRAEYAEQLRDDQWP